MLTLSISKALLCSAVQCWAVLVGTDTPVGEFELVQRYTEDAGYGGDVLQFDENETEIFAIHRVWTLRPKERREERLRSPNPEDRQITKGCVNVPPTVYDFIVSNHRGSKLRITK